MGRKRVVLLLVMLAFAIALTGCSDRTIYGEVSGVKTDDQTGTFSFVLTQDGAEAITVTTDENTHIFSWLDAVTESDLRAGATEGIMVSVTGRTSTSGMAATEVQIDQLLTRNAHRLEDGTQIDVLTGLNHTMYCLADGTELLMVQNPVGPDNVYVGSVESLDDLPKEAQQKIKDYYDAQGILYDELQTLEDAYRAYSIAPDSFATYILGQDIAPTASSDEIICFLTCVTMPDGGPHLATELRLGAVFDKETGDVIPAEELFTCERDEIIANLAQLCKLDDPALQAEMEEAFKPEYVIIFPDNLEITFPQGALPEYGTSFGMGFDYSPEVLELLQPWAVPKGSGTE